MRYNLQRIAELEQEIPLLWEKINHQPPHSIEVRTRAEINYQERLVEYRERTKKSEGKEREWDLGAYLENKRLSGLTLIEKIREREDFAM